MVKAGIPPYVTKLLILLRLKRYGIQEVVSSILIGSTSPPSLQEYTKSDRAVPASHSALERMSMLRSADRTGRHDVYASVTLLHS